MIQIHVKLPRSLRRAGEAAEIIGDMHRVLIIEDSEEFVTLLHALLDGDYEVRACRTGREGIDLARTWDPDVVLLDLTLPDIDGIEVCREIRSFSATYIVMVTGRSEMEERLVGLDGGADDYLVKPFDGRELQSRLRSMLRRTVPNRGAMMTAGDPVSYTHLTLPTTPYV